MLVPNQRTVIIVDPMAFRRARVESFLRPWAKDEHVELISLKSLELVHARLIESNCDMLIYNVGGASRWDCEILAGIRVLHSLRPAAALVILSDDARQPSIVAAMNSGANGYLNDSMAPGLALEALSFILHGGTYFPPAAILTAETASDTSVTAFPQFDFPRDILGEQPAPELRQQGQTSVATPEVSFLQEPRSPLDEQTICVQHSDGFADIQDARVHLNIPEPQLTDRQLAILCCLARGDSNKIIARTCHIAESTVKLHIKSILRKIRVRNRTQAAIWAIQNASDPSGILTTSDHSLGSPSPFTSNDLID
jgi:DNA-binding NarL/FixJ family response regulator